VFMGVVAPGFSMAHFVRGGWSGQDVFSAAAIPGIFAAIPFAIWFFLAIEGVAMAAEEARDPHRSIPVAYCAGILTLLALAGGVMMFAGAAGDWTRLSNINDPLPQAMRFLVRDGSPWLRMLVSLGLLGLIASFHGIIFGYSRQIFALGRAGILPAYFAKVHPRFNTPHRAVVAGGIVGIAAIYFDDLIKIEGASLSAAIVTISAFGAILMYIMTMAALFKLRRSQPEMTRPFLAPAYPYSPAFALSAAVICLITMIYYNGRIAAVFCAVLLAGFGLRKFR